MLADTERIYPKGARLSGKEGLVKKLIEGGKVKHRIIDVILPPDLQLKDRKSWLHSIIIKVIAK